MYRRCLFCRADLGVNEALPIGIGTKLAFDGDKGRLWVICPSCARWNLSPLEERWEAIEEAERLYRATRKRVATDNIGLAQVSDAVALVRIGAPLRPEFAAWRYGAEFLRRRRRSNINAAVYSAVAIGAQAAAAPLGLTWVAAFGTQAFLRTRELRRGGTALQLPDGSIVRVFSFAAGSTVLRRQVDGSVALQLAAATPRADRPWARRLGLMRAYEDLPSMLFTGGAMMGLLRTLLPLANGDGANRTVVDSAVSRLEQQPDPRDVLNDSIAKTGGRWMAPDKYLQHVDPAARLALEMALHEADEQAALQGDLAALEARWREAEEIAAIADDLLLPDPIRQRVDAARKDRGAGDS